MTIIGILTCEILELEFAHILAHDSEIAGIAVLEDAYSFSLIEALEAAHIRPGRIPLIKGFTPNYPGRLEVLVRVLELALHNRKRILQEGLVKAAKEMGRYVDAIVLGYGLCGNALQKPDELLADARVPIFIPMDEDHPVDDCVGLLIGGRDCYYAEQCEVAGTFFMIPGWTHHWRRIFDREVGNVSVDMAKRLFEHYERSLLIPTPVMAKEEMRKNIEDFNQLFGFRTEVRQGTMDILDKTWKSAKKYLLADKGRK
ncbi:MAG: DUF1638 domain-containing protein [Deltaproteobacteria bacterium]|nr:DUF1638 domain-containing protein [Deltaproteobacteria bacterium]